MKISRIHFAYSVNISNREKTYLEADKQTTITFLPELGVVEVVVSAKGAREVVHCNFANVKYYLPILETLSEPVPTQKAKAGTREAQASVST